MNLYFFFEVCRRYSIINNKRKINAGNLRNAVMLRSVHKLFLQQQGDLRLRKISIYIFFCNKHQKCIIKEVCYC